MQINVTLPRAPGTWTTRWKPRGAIRSFTRSCYWPTKSKITKKSSKSDTIKETLINRWAFLSGLLKYWWCLVLSLSLVFCVRQSCVDTGCNRTPSGVISRLCSDTVMIGLLTLLKNNSSVSLAGPAEKYGLKNYSQISCQWSPLVPWWWVKKLLK